VVPVLARRACFARWRGHRAVEHARGGRPHEWIERQVRRGPDLPGGPVRAVGQQQGTLSRPVRLLHARRHHGGALRGPDGEGRLVA